MALRYEIIAAEDKIVRSHTGLSREEFEQLSAAFALEWEHYMRHYTWEGKERRRQSKGRVNSVLAAVEDKLLFILFFVKTNPLQEVLATTFGLDQPQASRWLELLRARLWPPLPGSGCCPSAGRNACTGRWSVRARLSSTARSGRWGVAWTMKRKRSIILVKKSHTVKNVLLAATDKRILFLSQTYEGSVHDKRIADEADLVFEQTVELLQDSGFQGFRPANARVVQPLKKPKGRKLAQEHRQQNKEKASERVVIEHAIGQVKVWRIVKEKIRSCRHRLRDEVMLLACGLNNFKIKQEKLITPYST